MTFFVYLLVFADDRVYVGMSRTNKKGEFTARFFNHAQAARLGKPNPIYVAWREIGEPVQMVVSEHDDRFSAARAEIDLIAALDATNPDFGFNVALGGQGMHAPKGSAIHRVMKEKVWDNPAVRAKLSAAFKGKPVSQETTAGFRDWMENGGREHRSAAAKAQYDQPGVREAAADRTRQQMTEAARAHLSRKHKGRADPRSPEGKARTDQARRAYLDTPEGRANCLKGHKVSSQNPDNVAKRDANLATWRASEENRRNCQRIAALSAQACRRGVEDLKTGVVYASQREMAQALGISDGAVSLRVKKGTARRI